MAENGNGRITGEDIGKFTFMQLKQFEAIEALLPSKPHATIDEDGDVILEVPENNWRLGIDVADNPVKSFWWFISKLDDIKFSGRLENFSEYIKLIQELIRITNEKLSK